MAKHEEGSAYEEEHESPSEAKAEGDTGHPLSMAHHHLTQALKHHAKTHHHLSQAHGHVGRHVGKR